MSENEGGYEVLDGGVGLVTIRCRESGQAMTMWADEALGVGRVLAADDIAALTAEVERLRAAYSKALLEIEGIRQSCVASLEFLGGFGSIDPTGGDV